MPLRSEPPAGRSPALAASRSAATARRLPVIAPAPLNALVTVIATRHGGLRAALDACIVCQKTRLGPWREAVAGERGKTMSRLTNASWVCGFVLSCAFAQGDRGTITGTVTDPSGAVVAGARVSAQNADTQNVLETVTTATGNFTLAQVPVGTWDVAVEAAGFKAVPTGIEHGTITVVAAGQPFEVTTLREDVETFGRRAKVAFGRDWRRDASVRAAHRRRQKRPCGPPRRRRRGASASRFPPPAAPGRCLF